MAASKSGNEVPPVAVLTVALCKFASMTSRA